MMRRVELLLGIGTVLAAVWAIIATIFQPIGTTGMIVGRTSIIHHVYAHDYGLAPMIAVIVFIVLLAAGVLLGAYYHARRNSTSGRMVVLVGTLLYILLGFGSFRQGGFALYPAIVALACALVELIPARRHRAPEVGAQH